MSGRYQISSFNVLQNTIKQRDEEHQSLLKLIRSTEGKQTSKEQRDQIAGAYLSLFNLETKIKRNLNDHYYKIMKMKDSNKESTKFKAYDDFMKKTPPIRYTSGQKKYTSKKQADLLKGTTYQYPTPKIPVMSPDERDKQDATNQGNPNAGETPRKDPKTSDPNYPKEREGEKESDYLKRVKAYERAKKKEKEAKAKALKDASANKDRLEAYSKKLVRAGGVSYNLGLIDYLADSDRKLYLQIMDLAEKEYTTFTKGENLKSGDRNVILAELFNKNLATSLGEGGYNNILGQYQNTVDAKEKQEQKEEEQKEQEKTDTEFERKRQIKHAEMNELLKNFSADQEDSLDKYLDTLQDSDIRQRAYEKMMSKYASSYGGYTDQAKLLRYFMYKEMSEHSGANTAHNVKSETAGGAIPQEKDILTDQDNDGDIDRDDFVEKYGKEGRTGVRGATGKKVLEEGKYTDAEIQEAIDAGISAQSIKASMEKELGDTGSRAGVIPQDQVTGTDTKFEGNMAGIDEELNLGDMGGSPAQPAQPAQEVKTNILGQFEKNTEDAGMMIESKLRGKKKIDELKMEIKCFHQIYEDLIPAFKEKEHQEDYKKVLETNNIESVRRHHAMMSKMIRAYYKTSHLRLGVIMSAESVFGGKVGNIPAMKGSFGVGIPVQRNSGEAGSTLINRRRGQDRFSNATAGEKRVIRGGMNSKKAIKQAVPRDIDTRTHVGKIDPPNYNYDDAFRARSYIRKRIYTNPQVKIKVGKH